MTDPWASGVLDPERHQRLVDDLPGYAKDAGIKPHWIYTPAAGRITPTEYDFLRGFRQSAGLGLAYVGDFDAGEVDARMQLMAGVLVRNFVRARVMTLGTLLDQVKVSAPPEVSCLLVPNFCLGQADGATIAQWQTGPLLDLLFARRTQTQKTVLYIRSMNVLAKEYGKAFSDFIASEFALVEA